MEDIITDCLRVLGHAVEFNSSGDNPTEVGSFDNDVFTLEAYCWCDGTIHLEDCPPNFTHKRTGYSVSWYKHLGRGVECKPIEVEKWWTIFRECFNSLK